QREWDTSGKKLLAGPADDGFVQAVAALRPENQVRAATEMLRKLHQSEVRVWMRIQHGVVTDLGIHASRLTDLSPVRALRRLKTLWCHGGHLTDVTPLRGMMIEFLELSDQPFRDLSGLAGLPLKRVDFCGCPNLRDLTALKGMQLDSLNCGGSSAVADLE